MFVCGGENPENLEMDLKIRLEGFRAQSVLRLADMSKTIGKRMETESRLG